MASSPTIAELAALVQGLVDGIAKFKDEQTNLYTTSNSMATVTGSNGDPVAIPSWSAVQAASGYDFSTFERGTLVASSIIARIWPNQQLAAPTSAQDWFFSASPGDTALVHVLRMRKGSVQRDLLASVVINNGVGALTLTEHSLAYDEGLELVVHTGSVTGFASTLRYLFLV